MWIRWGDPHREIPPVQAHSDELADERAEHERFRAAVAEVLRDMRTHSTESTRPYEARLRDALGDLS